MHVSLCVSVHVGMCMLGGVSDYLLELQLYKCVRVCVYLYLWEYGCVWVYMYVPLFYSLGMCGCGV